MRTLTPVAWISALVVTLWYPPPASAQQTRPMRPQDVTRRERLDSSLSPDGKSLLYLRLTQFAQAQRRLFVVDLAGREQRELTKQIDPRARIDAWAWSPSGRRIALAGAIGPATTVWIGDRDSGRIAPFPHRGFRTSAPPALVWASENELILSTISDEAIGTFFQAEDMFARQWAKTNDGVEPSRSILDTGVERADVPGRMGSWVLLNLRDGSASSTPDGGTSTRRVAAPDGKAIASLYRKSHPRLDQPGLVHDTDLALSIDGFGMAVVMVDRGTLVVRRVKEAVDALGDGLTWSPDAGKLAFFGRRSGGGREWRVFTYDPRADSLAEMNTEGLSPSPGQTPFAWSGRELLTVLMSSAGAPGKPPGRPDWWAVRSGAPPKNLTASIAANTMQMPAQLIADPAGSLFGIFGNDLWRLDRDGGPPVKLGAKSDLREVRLEKQPEGRAHGQIVVTAKRGDARIFGRLDIADGKFTEITRPPGEARLIDFHPATGAALFDVQSGRESSLWASTPAHETSKLVAAANAHLRDVAEPAMKAIEYQDANGGKLHGWLVLPPGFTADRRWPLVAYVYPGTVYSDLAKPWLDDDSGLLAGHGYVVLRPSMPLAEGARSRNPYDALAQQVLPALDKAIELGIADPKRLGVMGHSFGGYAVNALIAQTTRFQAAIASASMTNLVSHYGQFHTRLARSDFPLDETQHVSWSETGQGRLGDPLWNDIQRYMYNSPIQYVGRVQTPLLLLHGDLDFVSIQQAEEFYTSLARRGKRARFVRYWGEGHMILTSPANYVDYWQQIYAWLDELLAKK